MWHRVENDVVITVLEPPTVPVMLGASYNAATGNNEVRWNASSSQAGISHYVVERMPDGLTFTTGVSGTVPYLDGYLVVAGRTYVYRPGGRPEQRRFRLQPA